jgi:hypothetical protein
MAKTGKPRLEIHYPEPYDAVPAFAYQDQAQTYYFIAATGKAHNLQKSVVAWLLNQDTTANPHMVVGTITQDKDNWTAAFAGLPAAPGRYFLVVGETDADLKTAGDLVATVEFRVVAQQAARPLNAKIKAGPPARPPKVPLGSIPITCPAAADTVCPQFLACGTLLKDPTTAAQMDLNGQVTAGVLISNGVGPTGTGMNGVPPGVWLYQFADLADSNAGYKFTVTDKGGASGANANISVDSTVCSPVVGPPPPPP